MIWLVVFGVAGAVLACWLVLVVVLVVVRPAGVSLSDAMRLLPDLLRLLRRMASDRSLSRGVRIRLGLLIAYLAMPIDLIPDFIPVLGYADDLIVAALVLRSVVSARAWTPWPRIGPERMRGSPPYAASADCPISRSTRFSDVASRRSPRASPARRDAQGHGAAPCRWTESGR